MNNNVSSVAVCGTTTDALAAGGYSLAAVVNCEIWSGSS